MRACAAALVVLAVLTECLGASDRSRQRSQSRNAPVAKKRQQVDFDCPEEFGYYPHPTDCTLYYVCVFGGALLESCTGGLMYSHELQTCDWPRNVGCDVVSAVGGEELERLSERQREPPRPAPRRNPPPPPRAQPNPVVTSRGQPKFNRDEYEKQQQLYAEVDDLPPVEEIESDRQQRVYRGQPSTIGQVQKDRDGYTSQVVSSGRNFNNNIIPASIPQNSGKIGSFSFGSQVDDRRAATITQAPQSYSDDILTDSHNDRRFDIETNDIDGKKLNERTQSRKKREVATADVGKNETKSNIADELSKRSDSGESMEYFEIVTESDVDDDEDENKYSLDDSERGKRQVRYYLKNGYKTPSKNWSLAKPIKFIEVPQQSYNPNAQSGRYQTGYNNNNYYDNNRRPQYSINGNSYSAASNPFLVYQTDNSQSQRPFKASLPDKNLKHPHNPLNVATQIITKSPPISALTNNENQFSSLNGGFYNNAYNNYQGNNQFTSITNRPNSAVSFQDSSLLPSSVVTGKPIPVSTSSRPQNNYQSPSEYNQRPAQNYEPESESEEEEEDYSEEDQDDKYKNDFPKPPYEFTHPSNKYADIKNPFADPNFDFDAYLSKLSNGQYTTQRPNIQNVQSSTHGPHPVDIMPISHQNKKSQSSTLQYDGMSTPRPFSVPSGPEDVFRPVTSSAVKQTNNKYVQRPQTNQQYQQQSPAPSQPYNQQQQQNIGVYQQNAGIPLEAQRPKLRPPNFKDDRQLPISYSFNKPIEITLKPNQRLKENQHFSVTSKPYIFLTATGTPFILSSPKPYVVKSEKIVSLPQQQANGKPYLSTAQRPYSAYITIENTTPNPLTTLANQQLKSLQQYWNASTESISSQYVTIRPSTTPDHAKLGNLFAQAVRTSMQTPTVKHQSLQFASKSSTTTVAPKRRPIPKPSPEMADYYYDEDEYYEPPVKSQYMPSTEVKPQRPFMAQNYKEYDDDSYEDSQEETVNIKPRPTLRRPINQNILNPETATKNHNDVSIITKTPQKDYNKHSDGKIPIPVLVNFASPKPTVLIRPELSSYEIIHRNRTMHIRRPVHENNPYTLKPPKYLNQTTLRPYTVRHRLAKPTSVIEPTASTDDKPSRGRGRHPNIVAQMLSTPRDSHNQETRFTKTKYDGRTNSLEPTESVAPINYSPSPRPKMLYNGSQNYSPDQYDPFYAIYDEDGELYKDTDYVQQYNTASLRPAVQQTYRGTPPPARRPVETYSPRPVTQDDYDDALIQGQISNQNQYQSPVRQSTRGEGNELGYDHNQINPSSVRTTLYEAPSTTPQTTSTSTTQRSTTAPFTEAMTLRYTPRSPTVETPIPESSDLNSSDESVSSYPVTPSPVINFSSLAKPFEKTDNLYRLKETISTTEKIPSSRRPSQVTNNNNDQSVEVVRSDINKDMKKFVSLTTGFSIRRNSNNTNNPYTLTLLSRPFEDYDSSRRNQSAIKTNSEANTNRYYYDSSSESNKKLAESTESRSDDTYQRPSENPMRRKDSRSEISEEYDIPVHARPHSRTRSKSKVKSTTSPSTSTTKYYLKSVIKRPAPFSKDTKDKLDSPENIEDVGALIEAGLQNARPDNEIPDFPDNSNPVINITPRSERGRWQNYRNEPAISPYKTLDNLRNHSERENLVQVATTSVTPTPTPFTSTTAKSYNNYNNNKRLRVKPSYYSYRLEDEDVPDQTTEVFSGKVKNVIKAFLDLSSPAPQSVEEFSSSTFKPSTTTPQPEPKIVNIGFHKKTLKYVDDKPSRNNVKRLQIITEPSVSKFFTSSIGNVISQDFSSTVPPMTTMSSIPYVSTTPATTPFIIETSTFGRQYVPSSEIYQSKFNKFKTNAPQPVTTTPPTDETSRKFQNIIKLEPTVSNVDFDKSDERKTAVPTIIETTKASEIEWQKPSIEEVKSEIASTTSTTKSTTTTVKKVPTTKSTKSVSFPTRTSRVNPAIKLAASNPGSGRRSYQSSSKCSSDNSLQDPKCNEIKYQRPTSTRGRGSAHYSTLGGKDAPQPAPNRGTPPTRSRPTLKPSTAIVNENTKQYVDIYAQPPSRPAPVYPQPTVDKTAAKCRKDVCLLPDCSCGGKEIPGELPVEQVPQIVILTFDDSVNDLNKVLYQDLFEKGRVNPNGCPISATFYVSHEWTDYSQVQNLYSAGHEMASHTISHSFGEQFSQKKWNREVGGQREILAAYGGVKLEDVRGMRAPFLSIGGNKMFKMLYDSNFTYDSSMPVYENRPPSWPYTLDYKLFHDCMIPPCPTKSYPGVWEVPMVMWQDLNGGRCSMGDACANPPEAEGVYKMLLKNFDRHYTTNRAPFGLFYHAAWFTQPHHKAGFIMFMDFINQMQDVWIVTNWQALQWVRDPTPISRINSFQPFQCNYQDRPKKCNNPKVCNLWHKSGVRYMRTCQPCPEVYPWTGKSGIRSSRIDNDNGE